MAHKASRARRLIQRMKLLELLGVALLAVFIFLPLCALGYEVVMGRFPEVWEEILIIIVGLLVVNGPAAWRAYRASKDR
jgi:hypothetical protein